MEPNELEEEWRRINEIHKRNRPKQRWIYEPTPKKLAQARERVRRYQLKHGRRRTGNVDLAWVEVLKFDPCSYCGNPGGTLDHVIPLVGGGEHSEDNLVGACRSCNSSKWAHSLLFFLLSQ